MRHIKIDQEFKDQLVNNFKTYIESLTTIPAKLEYSTECKLPIKEKSSINLCTRCLFKILSINARKHT